MNQEKPGSKRSGGETKEPATQTAPKKMRMSNEKEEEQQVNKEAPPKKTMTPEKTDEKLEKVKAKEKSVIEQWFSDDEPESSDEEQKQPEPHTPMPERRLSRGSNKAWLFDQVMRR